MKNTFKYIAALAAFSAAALASGITVSAQNLDDGKYKEENGIAYAKRAKTNPDGTYTIDLETFVTGAVEVESNPIPADIVLVLDVSGSMSDNIVSYTYTARASQAYTYQNYPRQDNNRYYYLHTDGKYYPVSRGSYNSWFTTYYILSYTAQGQIYYLSGTGTTTTRPYNVTRDNATIWTGVLYTRTATPSGQTKLAALKEAVLNFINIIDQNDTDNAPEGKERLGNRIGIVTFSSDSDIENQLTALSDKQSLITTINNLGANGGTNAHLGMNDALTLLTPTTGPDGELRQLKTTVMFTDGNPGLYGDWEGNNRQGTWNSANNTINYASQIKALAVESEDPDEAVYSKVYTVGVFSESSVFTDVYMGKTSSNYKADATSMGSFDAWDSDDPWSNGSGTALPAVEQTYSFMASDAEALNDIFESIAHASGGSGNTNVSGGSSVTVDIVSSSFSVPQGYASHPQDAITVLVAPCVSRTTIDGQEYLVFGEEKAPTEYGLPAITPSINETDNKVSTTGFDYSANWCGPDQTSTSTIQPGYHGFKQIIRFIINVKDDAVGGPAVETNDPDSGIYLEGSDEPLIKFNRPNVKLPVQIWIQKQGLQGDDSAVFTIRRIKYRGTFETDENGDYILDANGNPIRIDYSKIPKAEWDTFTKVVVNSKDLDANGMVKIVGLDPDYVYKLEEDAWAFGYTYQDGGIQYTIGDNVDNPFVFVNIPNNTKFDEATARNVFTEKKASTETK